MGSAASVTGQGSGPGTTPTGIAPIPGAGCVLAIARCALRLSSARTRLVRRAVVHASSPASSALRRFPGRQADQCRRGTDCPAAGWPARCGRAVAPPRPQSQASHGTLSRPPGSPLRVSQAPPIGRAWRGQDSQRRANGPSSRRRPSSEAAGPLVGAGRIRVVRDARRREGQPRTSSSPRTGTPTRRKAGRPNASRSSRPVANLSVTTSPATSS